MVDFFLKLVERIYARLSAKLGPVGAILILTVFLSIGGFLYMSRDEIYERYGKPIWVPKPPVVAQSGSDRTKPQAPEGVAKKEAATPSPPPLQQGPVELPPIKTVERPPSAVQPSAGPASSASAPVPVIEERSGICVGNMKGVAGLNQIKSRLCAVARCAAVDVEMSPLSSVLDWVQLASSKGNCDIADRDALSKSETYGRLVDLVTAARPAAQDADQQTICITAQQNLVEDMEALRAKILVVAPVTACGPAAKPVPSRDVALLVDSLRGK